VKHNNCDDGFLCDEGHYHKPNEYRVCRWCEEIVGQGDTGYWRLEQQRPCALCRAWQVKKLVSRWRDREVDKLIAELSSIPMSEQKEQPKMKVKIEYEFDSRYSVDFPYWAKVESSSTHGSIYQCGVSFEDARAKLLARLQPNYGVAVPAAEEVEI
jgi:hypothetical protein